MDDRLALGDLARLVTKIARRPVLRAAEGQSPGPGPGSAALRQRLWFVVAGDFGAATEDPGAALGDGAVKGDEFRVEVAARLRLRHEMAMAPRTSVALSSPASWAALVGI